MKTFTKITKAAVNGENLYISDHWISNGHWVINKAKAENGPVFSSVESAKAALNLGNGQDYRRSTREFSDKVVDGYFKDSPHEYKITAWVHQGYRKAYRLLWGPDGKHGLVDERYAKLFGLEERDVLYSCDPAGLGSLSDKDKTFLVMPVSPDTAQPINLPVIEPED